MSAAIPMAFFKLPMVASIDYPVLREDHPRPLSNVRRVEAEARQHGFSLPQRRPAGSRLAPSEEALDSWISAGCPTAL